MGGFIDDGDYDGAGRYGYWWTATKGSGESPSFSSCYSHAAYSQGMNYDDGKVDDGCEIRSSGYSVRCVKD